MSITTKISAALVVVCGVALLYFTRTEIQETYRRYREATEEPLVDVAHLLSKIISSQMKSEDIDVLNIRKALADLKESQIEAKIYDLQKNSIDMRVYITDNRGTVIYDSDGGREEGKNYYEWNDVFKALKGKYGARTSREEGSNISTLYVAAPIIYDHRIVGSLTVAKSNANANKFILASQRSTRILGTVIFFIVAIVSLALIFAVTKPLGKLTEYVRSVRDGHPQKLPNLRSSEIKALGQAFEEMREALEGKKYIERYVKTLTHELKSPITAIKGAAEVLGEDVGSEQRSLFLGNIKQESNRIQNLVERLLAISSLQTGSAEFYRENLSVHNLIAEVGKVLKPYADSKEIAIRYEGEEGAFIYANQFWLLEALKNLVQNALEFSPQSSTVKMRTENLKDKVVIIIEDEGVGIPEWAKEKIFDQFFSLNRPDTGRRSTGLGLSLVREIVGLHEGNIDIGAGAGTGTVVKLIIPKSAGNVAVL